MKVLTAAEGHYREMSHSPFCSTVWTSKLDHAFHEGKTVPHSYHIVPQSHWLTDCASESLNWRCHRMQIGIIKLPPWGSDAMNYFNWSMLLYQGFFFFLVSFFPSGKQWHFPWQNLFCYLNSFIIFLPPYPTPPVPSQNPQGKRPQEERLAGLLAALCIYGSLILLLLQYYSCYYFQLRVF